MRRDDFPNRFATFAELEREFGGSQLHRLSQSELARLERLRDQRRRTAWIWGRVLTKQLLIDEWNTGDISPSALTIRSHDDNGLGVSPIVTRDGVRQPCRISISHTDHAVLVAMSSEIQIGVDLVNLDGEELGAAACRLWFTSNELLQFARGDSLTPRVFWAVKEAAFKACSDGERFAPRRIEITPIAPDSFTACCDFSRGRRVCDVTIRRHGRHVSALAIPQSREYDKQPEENDLSGTLRYEIAAANVIATVGGRMS